MSLVNQVRGACSDPESPLYGSDLIPMISDLCDLVEELEAEVERLRELHRVMRDSINCRNFLAEERNRCFQMQGAYDGASSEECKALWKRNHDVIAQFLAEEQRKYFAAKSDEC